MRVLRSAAFGCAVALGAASAHAQNVITRQIDNEPVETTVTQTPTGTVNVVYRTVVQQQVVPAAPAGYPPYPAPAYQSRTVVVAPNATTGYGWTAPAAVDLDEDYLETVPAVAPVPRYTTARYAVGSVLPAGVVATPLPATAAVRVPAVQPYSYATVDGRILLVDPATNTVVADITP